MRTACFGAAIILIMAAAASLAEDGPQDLSFVGVYKGAKPLTKFEGTALKTAHADPSFVITFENQEQNKGKATEKSASFAIHSPALLEAAQGITLREGHAYKVVAVFQKGAYDLSLAKVEDVQDKLLPQGVEGSLLAKSGPVGNSTGPYPLEECLEIKVYEGTWDKVPEGASLCRVTSDVKGHYKIALKPGKYTLVSLGGKFLQTCEVSKESWLQLDIVTGVVVTELK
ncbi:MAG: hypothetical protein KIS92_00580 [Planctomycetota bacterium]|nr:hypothetical protein [Planctomycetota bacterium]